MRVETERGNDGRPPDLCRRMLATSRLEVMPFASVEPQLAGLARGDTVTVTCSPRHGVDHTLAFCERWAARGLDVVPHVAARMVADREHVERIAARLCAMGVAELFVVGGDQRPPLGCYASARELMEALAPLIPGVPIGVSGYPEGHPSIPARRLLDELTAKQDLASSIVTQLCFDPAAIAGWLRSIRAAGITLPVLVGVPGVVDRRRLLELSTRIGVGASTRYLRKNLRLAIRLFAQASFEPGALVDALAAAALDPASGIEGLHVFTFNQVAATVAWRARLTEEIVDA